MNNGKHSLNIEDSKYPPQMSLFLNNAFLFYRNAHRILSDSRMSFATVPIILKKNKKGIRYVTLGALVEWWLNCEEDVTKDKDGHDALTYHLVGNALTGTNQCYCVYPDGQAEKIVLKNFGTACSSFMNTCKKYAETPEGIDVLTLEEVVNVLANAEMSIEAKLSIQLIKEERQRVVLEKKYDKLNRQHITLEDQYYHLAIEHHRVKLEEFRKEHILRKDKTDTAIRQLEEMRAEYRTQMKQGLITNVEYQRLFMDLEKQKKTINSEFIRFKYDAIQEIEESGFITSLMIERFLQEGVPQNKSEEEQMSVNVSYERYRKALIRAAQENKYQIEAAGKSIYVLERTCLDNLIRRSISSPIAVAETKEKLIDFCHSMYGDDIPFDEKGKTPTIRIPMGDASFKIITVANL